MKKYHIGATNNMAHLLIESESYYEALKIVNDGLSLSNKYHISIAVNYLLHTKLQCLYMMEKFNDSIVCYHQFKQACETNDAMNYFNEVNNSIKVNYPLIFKK